MGDGNRWTQGSDHDWRDDAQCKNADPNIFFPTSQQPLDEALSICAMCSVRDECLECALVNFEDFGVWGGMSARQRRKLRSLRRRLAS